MNGDLKLGRAAARSGEWVQHFSNASCFCSAFVVPFCRCALSFCSALQGFVLDACFIKGYPFFISPLSANQQHYLNFPSPFVHCKPFRICIYRLHAVADVILAFARLCWLMAFAYRIRTHMHISSLCELCDSKCAMTTDSFFSII